MPGTLAQVQTDGRVVQARTMLDDVVTAADLLNAWREAMQAAVLAERLVGVAVDASVLAGQTDRAVAVSDEVAALAARTARAAEHAASDARSAAVRTGSSATRAPGG